MPNTSTASLVFHPAYCFSLSPTYNIWARLTARDVHELKERAGFEGQNLYFHLNHPIKWISLVGLIVAIDIFSNRISYILDDSSGITIEITCGRPIPPRPTTVPKPQRDPQAEADEINCMIKQDLSAPAPRHFDLRGLTANKYPVDLNAIDVGCVVNVKGGVGCYRGERQVSLERIDIVRTTREEVTAWAKTTAFRRDVLDRPWVVSGEDEQRERKKAEGLDRARRARGPRGRKVKGQMTTQKREREITEKERDMRKREEEKAKARKEEVKRRKLQEEEKLERARKVKEEKEMKEEEERAKRIRLKKMRDEVRERALRELGAGR